MISCSQIQHQFSRYLDGDVPGKRMIEITRHLDDCAACAREFAAWQKSQSLVSTLGPTPVPPDLALRLRVAISQESRNSTRERLGRFHMRWENTFRPFLLRAGAGLASAVFLVGTAATLVGTFTSPEPVEARDVPLDTSSAPRLLYSSFQADDDIGAPDNPVVLQVYVDSHGRVYDYKVLSGSVDTQTRQSIDNLLLFSVFSPARFFDQPVRGTAVMSFSGVSVKG
ncbi:MAG TPA: zf-HC2 domain-containing protein [Edaphobacter sp.]|nr:zf-HC2 domain-containing protein [Edaphobacter sp.]